MGRHLHHSFAIAAIVISISFVSAVAQSSGVRSASYEWKNVQITGGGFVSGIIFHPTAPGVRYARTDIGGAYRWNGSMRRWEPLLDWVSHEDSNLMGVESVAVDPSDAQRVYLACGTYTRPAAPNAAILRSSDGGRTFQRTNMPFKMGGNENGRGNGERLAVDPNDGSILYFGSRHAGLWKSGDRGVNWKHVDSFPDVTETPNRGSGIVFVLFDPRGAAIYVGVSLMGRDNLFRSTDAGETWHAVPGQPRMYRPNHAALASDGTLYLSYGSDPGPRKMQDGGVWKLDTASGRWTDITPEKPDLAKGRPFGYGAVSVDARNPRALIASTFGRSGGEELFRSNDGGQTWQGIFGNGGTYDFSLAPYVARTPIHWLLDIEIDPVDSDHALFTTGYGGYETFDLTSTDSSKPTKWTVMSTGIEETVALDLLSPPQGAHLLTAIGDYGGFVHWDLDRPEPAGNYVEPSFGNTTSLSAANSPGIIVRVGRASDHRSGNSIGYSLDGGRTWRRTQSVPTQTSTLGSIAVSSNGASWLWTPERSYTYFTHDRGSSWTTSIGLPADSRVIADAVNPRKFYAVSLRGATLYVSTDGGATFKAHPLKLPDGSLRSEDGYRGDVRGGQDRLYAAPGHEGDLWLAAFDGLYHSIDSGATWIRRSGVEQIQAFGFGKAAPGSKYPTLYLAGSVRGVHGIFRSDDAAIDWTRINDDQHQWGLILQISGDPKRYGRVYVGTHGRGILYGDPH